MSWREDGEIIPAPPVLLRTSEKQSISETETADGLLAVGQRKISTGNSNLWIWMAF